MAPKTKRPKNNGIGKGLWVDQEVLARHLRSGAPRSSHSGDKNAEVNHHIMKLADIALREESRFDQE